MAFHEVRYIRNYGVLRDIEGPRDHIPPFAKRNLIYGWNYSGKTTLSRIFASLAVSAPHPDYITGEFAFKLQDGNTWGSSNITSNYHTIRVFNSDYIRDNLRWDEGLDPILIVGEENIALQRRLDFLDHIISQRSRYDRNLKSRRRSETTRLESTATTVADRVRKDLNKVPFNRAPHLQRYVDHVRGDTPSHLLSDDRYRQLRTRLAADQRADVPYLSHLCDPSAHWESATRLLGRTAQQRTIESLRDNFRLERWIEEGLHIHEAADTCQFCGNQLPADRLAQLAEHFSDAVQSLKSDCDELVQALREARDATASLHPGDAARLYTDLQEQFETESGNLQRATEGITAAIDSLLVEIHSKKQHPDESYAPSTPSPTTFVEGANAAINALNRLIQDQNDRNAAFEEQKSEVTETLIKHEAANYVEEQRYNETMNNIAQVDDRTKRNNTRCDDLIALRDELKEELSDAHRGAQAINRYLQLYFGKDDIAVQLRTDGKYDLVREGGKVKNLSEGERTAIAFSYFLTNIMDGNESLERMVVCIDDPVSSLDSNHIYNTYAMIKSLLDPVQQLFLLTHNYELFRIAKSDSFFAEIRNEKVRSRWYLIWRSDKTESEICDIPNTLRKFSSEYHFIFVLLYRFGQNPDHYDEIYFNIPNLLRKLLETYTSFRMPGSKQSLKDKLDEMFEDEVAAAMVYRFVNHLSHTQTMDANLEFPARSECIDAVNNSLEALQNFDPPHHEAMVALAEAQ